VTIYTHAATEIDSPCRQEAGGSCQDREVTGDVVATGRPGTLAGGCARTRNPKKNKEVTGWTRRSTQGTGSVLLYARGSCLLALRLVPTGIVGTRSFLKPEVR